MKYKEEVYEYCKSYILKNGYCPTYREIQKALDIKSLSSINKTLIQLEKEGRVKRAETGSRFTLTCLEVIDNGTY